MSEQFTGQSATTVAALAGIVGRRHVLTSPRKTAPYAQGARFGSGHVLAVVQPGTLVEMWRALKVCVKNNVIVIPQAANTGLTGGSGPGDQDYDRPIVIFSTLRIHQIHLINDAHEAVCLAGATLYNLTDILKEKGREPHSVIGSSSIGATVVGGISNNSGGSQIRKGPAFTRQAVFARVTAEGKVQLVNHMGINLGDNPEEILERLQRGDWNPTDVSPAPSDDEPTEYSRRVREIVDSPARYNANPDYLYEASGCAGKLMVFAVRTRSFPLEKEPVTFYIGTNDPAALEDVRRAFLTSDHQLPISGEYMSKHSFELAEKYGKDTYTSLKYTNSDLQVRLFAVKTWANGVFGKIPLLGPHFADQISQVLFSVLPAQVPKRLTDYRDRFDHHLLLIVSGAAREETQQFLMSFFSEQGHEGEFFTCDDDEAKCAMLIRFGVASAATRYSIVHHKEISDLVAIDVALRRDDDEWLEVLPDAIAEQLVQVAYYGHFFCHVLHQDYIPRLGVDSDGVKAEIKKLLEARGAKFPAEHNYGRIYHVSQDLEDHYRSLDPCNVFNAGIGGTSAHKNWE